MNRASMFLCFVLAACGDDEPRPTLEPGETTGDTTTSLPPTDDDGSSGPSSVRADLGVEPPTVCEGACAVTSTCQGGAASDCLLRCTAELAEGETVSASCGQAHEALEGCIAGLSCDELAAHGAGGESSCRAAAQQVAVDCDTSGDTSSPACADLCTALLACGLAEETACLANCIELRSAAATSGSSCAAAQDEQLTCVASLECTTLDAWVSTGSTPSCTNDLDQACSGDEE